MTKQTVPASMTQGPEAKRISDRMTELGLELAKYPFVPHPRRESSRKSSTGCARSTSKRWSQESENRHNRDKHIVTAIRLPVENRGNRRSSCEAKVEPDLNRRSVG